MAAAAVAIGNRAFQVRHGGQKAPQLRIRSGVNFAVCHHRVVTPQDYECGQHTMMHSLEGDLLLSKAELIAHGVAPNDDWKSSLAMALRERFPALHKDFRHYCHQSAPKPGTLWLWQGVDQHGRRWRIANLFTQDAPSQIGGHPGRARPEYVNHALHELRKLVEHEELGSIALPRLATGVGGLEWQNVEPLIKTQLGALKIPIYVYTKFVPNQAAKEPAGVKPAD